MKQKVSDHLLALLFCLFFRVESWLCSLPAWATLIGHFVFGLSIWWFWGTLAAWLLAGLLRYGLLLFARWGRNTQGPEKPNKNPYSHKKDDPPTSL